MKQIRLKLMDMIGIVLIVVGIAITVLNFYAARQGPSSSMESVIINELPNHRPKTGGM